MATGVLNKKNHITDESMKTGQSVGLFGQLLLLATPEWRNLCIRHQIWQPRSEETGDVELGMSALHLQEPEQKGWWSAVLVLHLQN